MKGQVEVQLPSGTDYCTMSSTNALSECVQRKFENSCGEGVVFTMKNGLNLRNCVKAGTMSSCEIHPTEIFFCKDCESVVCKTCETYHEEHSIVELHEASADYKTRMKTELQKVRVCIRYLYHILKDVRSYLEKLGNNLAEITAQILDRAHVMSEHNELPEVIEVVADTMIHDIQMEHESESNRLKEKIHEFENAAALFKSIASQSDDVLSWTNDTDVIQMSGLYIGKMHELQEALPECLSERCIYMLSPMPECSVYERRPEELLGTFDKVTVPWRIEVKRIGSFRPEAVASSRFVTSMCCAGDDEVWIVWQWGPRIHLVNKDGNVKKTVNIGCKVDDICMDNTGNLVVSCHETRCIKRLDANYQVVQTIDIEKVPRGVEFLSNDKMVVCYVQNLHHRNGDKSGVQRVSFENDVTTDVTNDAGCLLQPWRIAVNRNGDICVSDRNKGQVVIFDSSGRLKTTYSGPDMSTRHAFAPHGISCDEYGQIFVVDYSNHTVHVLDSLGRFRGFLIMDTELEKMAIFMGTSSPFSMAIDNGGDVWVGNKFGYITVLKYNM